MVAVVGAAHREFVDAEGVIERVGAGLDAFPAARAGAVRDGGVGVGCGPGAVAAGDEEREGEQVREHAHKGDSERFGDIVVIRHRFVTNETVPLTAREQQQDEFLM